MTSKDILKALRRHHNVDSFYRNTVFFEELKVGTGYKGDNQQALDAFAMDLWPSDGFKRYVYEVKVSRKDFRKELKNSKKRRRGLLLSNYFYFVTPKGLIDAEKIPVECGLIEVNEKGNLEFTLDAPFREYARPTWAFIAAICRRVQEVESRSLQEVKV
jgi:hypothetical protein